MRRRKAPTTTMGQVAVALISTIGGVGVGAVMYWLLGDDVNVSLLAVLVPVVFVLVFAAARRTAQTQADSA